MKEQDLISAVLAGDTGAREAFYDAYYKLVWHIIHSIGLNENDAEELFQEVFVHFFKDDCACLRHWHGGLLSAFLARVVRNQAIDFLRAKQRLNKGTVPWSDLGGDKDGASSSEVPDPRPSPEALALTREARNSLREGLSEIALRDRDLLLRFHFQGQTYEEIAADTGMSINNIGVSLKRARARLRARLHMKYPGFFEGSATP